MMATRFSHLILASFLVAFVGCATPRHSDAWRQGTTTINVTGMQGMRITGFYVQEGQRYPVASTLPFVLTETGLSEIEIRKVNRDEALTVEARFEAPGMHTNFANMAAAPGVPGVRVQVGDGFTVENLKR